MRVTALYDGTAGNPSLCEGGAGGVVAVIVMNNERAVEDVEFIIFIKAHARVPCEVVGTVG